MPVYEHHRHPLLPRVKFIKRVLSNVGVATFIVTIALGMGVLGYHEWGGLNWIDSLLNASMILTGMGPVNELTSTAGKLFASFYALFSGIIFLSVIVIVLAPIIHRFLHKFHVRSD